MLCWFLFVISVSCGESFYPFAHFATINPRAVRHCNRLHSFTRTVYRGCALYTDVFLPEKYVDCLDQELVSHRSRQRFISGFFPVSPSSAHNSHTIEIIRHQGFTMTYVHTRVYCLCSSLFLRSLAPSLSTSRDHGKFRAEYSHLAGCFA